MTSTVHVEKTYFTNGNVTVTNTRFIVPAQTFAMSGITSVKYQKDAPNRLWPIALLLAGFFVANSNAGSSIWHYGLFMLPGVLWLSMQRAAYSIQLSSASGETRALVSKKADFISSVVDALNQSIVERG